MEHAMQDIEKKVATRYLHSENDLFCSGAGKKYLESCKTDQTEVGKTKGNGGFRVSGQYVSSLVRQFENYSLKYETPGRCTHSPLTAQTQDVSVLDVDSKLPSRTQALREDDARKLNAKEQKRPDAINDSPLTVPLTAQTQDVPVLDVESKLPSRAQVLGKDAASKLNAKEQKRLNIINELCDTEKDHVQNLKNMDKLFYRPMLRNQAIPQEFTKSLFPNLETLIKLHGFLSDAMEKRREEKTAINSIGDILLQRFGGEAGDQFRNACAIFCRNQSRALEDLKRRVEKDSVTAQLLSKAEADPLCQRLALKDIIPKQCMRLTKYPLLIESLLKYTQTNTEEYSSLESSLKRTKDILEYVNEAVKDCENHQRLIDFERKIEKKYTDDSLQTEQIQRFDLRKHKLLHDGLLTWTLENEKKIELHVLLLERVLVLLHKNDEKLVLKVELVTSKPHSIKQSPLLCLTNVIVTPDSTDKKAFFIVYKYKVEPQMYRLVAGTSGQQKAWIKCITEAKKAMEKNKFKMTMKTPEQEKILTKQDLQTGVEKGDTQEMGTGTSVRPEDVSDNNGIDMLRHNYGEKERLMNEPKLVRVNQNDFAEGVQFLDRPMKRTENEASGQTKHHTHAKEPEVAVKLKSSLLDGTSIQTEEVTATRQIVDDESGNQENEIATRRRPSTEGEENITEFIKISHTKQKEFMLKSEARTFLNTCANENNVVTQQHIDHGSCAGIISVKDDITIIPNMQIKRKVTWQTTEKKKMILCVNGGNEDSAATDVRSVSVIFKAHKRNKEPISTKETERGAIVQIRVPDWIDGKGQDQAQLMKLLTSLINETEETKTEHVSLPLEAVHMWPEMHFITCIIYKTVQGILLNKNSSQPHTVTLSLGDEGLFDRTFRYTRTCIHNITRAGKAKQNQLKVDVISGELDKMKVFKKNEETLGKQPNEKKKKRTSVQLEITGLRGNVQKTKSDVLGRCIDEVTDPFEIRDQQFHGVIRSQYLAFLDFYEEDVETLKASTIYITHEQDILRISGKRKDFKRAKVKIKECVENIRKFCFPSLSVLTYAPDVIERELNQENLNEAVVKFGQEKLQKESSVGHILEAVGVAKEDDRGKLLNHGDSQNIKDDIRSEGRYSRTHLQKKSGRNTTLQEIVSRENAAREETENLNRCDSSCVDITATNASKQRLETCQKHARNNRIFQANDVVVKVCEADILSVPVDCVVNPANQNQTKHDERIPDIHQEEAAKTEKQICPICDQVCGIVTGNQPDGSMEIMKIRQCCTGYEEHKSIAMSYYIPPGNQGEDHPRPGVHYRSISRTEYLPDSKEGRQVCAMLKVAFEHRLVFTIGTSRTTWEEGVITWHDINHKTDTRPYTRFGYPDKSYLQRVREEMEIKGVTAGDIDKNFVKDLEGDSYRRTFSTDTSLKSHFYIQD